MFNCHMHVRCPIYNTGLSQFSSCLRLNYGGQANIAFKCCCYADEFSWRYFKKIPTGIRVTTILTDGVHNVYTTHNVSVNRTFVLMLLCYCSTDVKIKCYLFILSLSYILYLILSCLILSRLMLCYVILCYLILSCLINGCCYHDSDEVCLELKISSFRCHDHAAAGVLAGMEIAIMSIYLLTPGRSYMYLWRPPPPNLLPYTALLYSLE